MKYKNDYEVLAEYLTLSDLEQLYEAWQASDVDQSVKDGYLAQIKKAMESL